MRYRFAFLGVLALSLVLSAGCSEDGGEGGSGGTAGTGGMAGTGGAGGMGGTVETGEFHVTTWELAPDGDVAGPLGGVEVCEFGTAHCVVSDERGFATLQLPVERDIMVSVKTAGRGPILGVDVIPADELTFTSFFPIPEATLADAWEPIGFSYPPEEGTGNVFLSINAPGPAKPGAMFELLGANARAYYVGPDGYDADLSATSTKGEAGFFELASGEYEIRVGGTAENCTVWRGWESDSPNTVRFPVRPGYVTDLRVWCD